MCGDAFWSLLDETNKRNVAGARTSPYERNSRICQRSLDGWHWMNSENFLFAFVCVFFMIFLFRLALWLWFAASGWITIFRKAAYIYIGKHGNYDLFLAFVWRVTMTIWMYTRQVFVHTFHRYTRAMRIAQVTLFRFCFVSEFFFVEHNICLFHFGVYLNFETKCGMKRKRDKRSEKKNIENQEINVKRMRREHSTIYATWMSISGSDGSDNDDGRRRQ